MFKFCLPYFEHNDDRGFIKGLINEGEWKEVNLIFSKAGTIRGGHYHKKTYEAFIILKGEVEIVLNKIENERLTEEVVKVLVKEGDVFILDPFIYHTFYVLKDAQWINLLSEKINPENPDIHSFNKGGSYA